jgi:hypothetical protein
MDRHEPRGKRAAAVVVGGTHGIGRAVVDALLADGVLVLLTGRTPRTVEAARRDLGDRAAMLGVDLTDLADVDALRAAVEHELGVVDAPRSLRHQCNGFRLGGARYCVRLRRMAASPRTTVATVKDVVRSAKISSVSSHVGVVTSGHHLGRSRSHARRGSSRSYPIRTWSPGTQDGRM